MNYIVEWIQKVASSGLILWFVLVGLSYLYPGKMDLKLATYFMFGAGINVVVTYWR